MSIPQVGDLAPDFELASDTGQNVRLSELRGKRVVLYFYPRADSKGCTIEACGFRDDFGTYQQQDAVVLGVSPDTVRALARFKAKFELPFALLADPEHQVSEAYGVWGLKKFMGREFLGVKRTTFIIDAHGRISHVFERVKPKGHSAQVSASL